MKKDLLVVASCDKRAGLIGILEQQVMAAGIDFHVNKTPTGVWQFITSIGFRLNQVEKVLTDLPDYENYVFVDAWDTLFFGTKEELLDKIPEEGVILAAEKNCFPDKSMAEYIPTRRMPWQFVNGGGLAGSAKSIKRWIYSLKSRPGYAPEKLDQEYFNELLAALNPGFEIDHETKLFYCMFGDEGEIGRDELNGRPFNNRSEQWPSFIHFNGKTDPGSFLKEYGIKAEMPKRKPQAVDYVFCFPGNTSSQRQALGEFVSILTLMQTGKQVGIRSSQSCNIYEVRNRCLSTRGHEKQQKPFEGIYSSYDRIIWVDSDNHISAEKIQRLIAHDVDIVAAWYRYHNGIELVDDTNRTACGSKTYKDGKFTGKFKPILVGEMPGLKRDEKGLLEVDYAGMGLMLVKQGVFEALGYPWFRSWQEEWEENGVTMVANVTDDDGFCLRAKEAGYKIYIDPEIKIEHEKRILL